MLQVLGATSPLEALKAAGLAGVSLDEIKAKEEPAIAWLKTRPSSSGSQTSGVWCRNRSRSWRKLLNASR